MRDRDAIIAALEHFAPREPDYEALQRAALERLARDNEPSTLCTCGPTLPHSTPSMSPKLVPPLHALVEGDTGALTIFETEVGDPRAWPHLGLEGDA